MYIIFLTPDNGVSLSGIIFIKTSYVDLMKIIAHRGFRREYPENTIPAFRDAFNTGSDAVELDVHFTRDKEVVVFHDFDLQRFFGSPEAIGDLDRDAIQELTFPGTEIKIPTLEEVLMEFQGREIFIELKTVMDDGTLCYSGLPEKVMKIITEVGVLDSVRVISFDPSSVARVRELSRIVETGLDVSKESLRLFSPSDLKRFLEEKHIDHLIPEYSLLNDPQFFNMGKVKLSPWTVNVPSIIIGMERYLYGVITDFPDKFVTTQQRHIAND